MSWRSWGVFIIVAIFVVIVVENLNIQTGSYTDDFKQSTATQVEEKASEPIKSQPKRESPRKGETAIISNDTYLAFTEEVLDDLIAYANEKNKDAVSSMLRRGEIFPIFKGAKVTVVDNGFLTVKVRIPDSDITGYLPSEFVKKE